MQQSQSETKLPPIRIKPNKYIYAPRNDKGETLIPQNMQSHQSILMSSINAPNNRSLYNQTVDQSVINDFETLLGQVKQNKPNLSIYKSILQDSVESQKKVKQVEKINFKPLPDMQLKSYNNMNQPKKSVKKKTEKITKFNNPCKPLIKKHRNRNQSEAIMNFNNEYNAIDLGDVTFNKTPQSVSDMKRILSHYISNNRFFFNKEVIKIPEYEKSAPFYVDSLKYADVFLKGVKQVPKEYGFTEENLYRNNLVLEKVMLERLLKKENSFHRSQQVEEFIEEQERLHTLLKTQDRQKTTESDQIALKDTDGTFYQVMDGQHSSSYQEQLEQQQQQQQYYNQQEIQ